MSLQTVFLIVGIAFLAAAVAMAAWAVYSYVKLDIRAVREDLSGKARSQKQPKERKGARNDGPLAASSHPAKDSMPTQPAEVPRKVASKASREDENRSQDRRVESSAPVPPGPHKQRRNVSVKIIRKEMKAESAIDLDDRKE